MSTTTQQSMYVGTISDNGERTHSWRSARRRPSGVRTG